MTRKNVIDSFVIAEVAPIFLRDLAGNHGETEAILKVMRGRERLTLHVDGDILLS